MGAGGPRRTYHPLLHSDTFIALVRGLVTNDSTAVSSLFLSLSARGVRERGAVDRGREAVAGQRRDVREDTTREFVVLVSSAHAQKEGRTHLQVLGPRARTLPVFLLVGVHRRKLRKANDPSGAWCHLACERDDDQRRHPLFVSSNSYPGRFRFSGVTTTLMMPRVLMLDRCRHRARDEGRGEEVFAFVRFEGKEIASQRERKRENVRD